MKGTSGKLSRSSHSECLSLYHHQMRFCVTQTVSILSGSAGVKEEMDAIVNDVPELMTAQENLLGENAKISP